MLWWSGLMPEGETWQNRFSPCALRKKLRKKWSFWGRWSSLVAVISACRDSMVSLVDLSFWNLSQVHIRAVWTQGCPTDFSLRSKLETFRLAVMHSTIQPCHSIRNLGTDNLSKYLNSFEQNATHWTVGDLVGAISKITNTFHRKFWLLQVLSYPPFRNSPDIYFGIVSDWNIKGNINLRYWLQTSL